MFRALLRFLERQPQGIVLALSLALVYLIFAVDYVTGTDVAVFLFYWIPIALAAWRGGRVAGILIAILSTLAYFAANYRIAVVAGPLVLNWNATIRLGSHVIAALLVAELKHSFDRLRDLSQNDFLTGAYNTRAFYRLADEERVRASRYRHALTVGYLDIDDFKTVNDTHGHAAGDALLAAVARTIRSNLRRSDLLGRMGGDEFALLFPETRADAARQVFSKLQRELQSLVQGEGWPVTFSIGAVTYLEPPETTESMVQKADHLMYSVKNSSKNAVAYATEPPGPMTQRGTSSVRSVM